MDFSRRSLQEYRHKWLAMAGGGRTKVAWWVPNRSNYDEDGDSYVLSSGSPKRQHPKNGPHVGLSTRPRAVLMDIGGFKRVLASGFFTRRPLEKEMDWSLRCLPSTGFMKIRTI
jgi:hypothetical protein